MFILLVNFIGLVVKKQLEVLAQAFGLSENLLFFKGKQFEEE